MTRPYLILPLVERTIAWWEWRRTGIGSADAATILDQKPAKSVERLLIEKQQPLANAGGNFLRERGAAWERTARAQYIAATGIKVEPACVQSLARPWQRASLDGLSADGGRAVEIKCGFAAYQRAAAHRRPPPHHFAQLQHILAVTDLAAIDYWCYAPARPPMRIEVRRDENYIARLIAAEEIFFKRFARVR